MDSDPPLSLLFGILHMFMAGFSAMHIPVAVLLLLLFFFLSALVSGCEVALFSLSSTDLENLRNEKSRVAHRVLQLRAGSRHFLVMVLIVNTFSNVCIILLGAYLMAQWIHPAGFLSVAEGILSTGLFSGSTQLAIAEVFRNLLIGLIIIFLLILFGEVLPRVYAKMHPVKISRAFAGFMHVCVKLFTPLSLVSVKWSQYVEKRLEKYSSTNAVEASIKEDIDKAIDLAMPRDDNSRLEAGILKSIIKFNDVPVKQIMRSRVDVIAIEEQLPFPKLKEIIRSEGYSRMPVYKDNLDSILGILYVKDLIGKMETGDDFRWQDLVQQQVLYVPESKKINDLLKEFQKERVHMGIVVDEYGGTAGIVTLEDVMEEVIGEIKDEFDAAVEGDYRKIDAQTFLFDGKSLLNDVCRIIGVDSSKFDEIRGDADSLAGLILELSGKMPDRGEEFTAAGISFTVISVTSRRVEKIRVRIPGKK